MADNSIKTDRAKLIKKQKFQKRKKLKNLRNCLN